MCCDDGDCCKKVAKFILVTVNLFFFLLGLLMLACGIAMVAAPDKVANAVMDAGADLRILGNANYIIKAAGIFMIVLGGIVTLIGGFGFFGACCENRCLLIVYLIIVILVLLAEVALIIFAAVFPQKLEGWVTDEMKKTMITDFNQDIHIYANGSAAIDATNVNAYGWIVTQVEARCCGIYMSSDYINNINDTSKRQSTYSNGMSGTSQTPVSCCKTKAGIKLNDIAKSGAAAFVNLDGCLNGGPTNADYVYTNGCYYTIESMIKQASNIAIGIAAAIVGIEIIIIILGFYLVCYIFDSKSLSV